MRMEPFGAEECHSSESGWTMYIGSPMDEGGHSYSDDDDGDGNNKSIHIQAHPQNDDDDDEDNESDDSMASDASSGPSHHGFADSRQAAEEEYDENKCCLEKKANKKLRVEGKKVEKKGMVVVDSKGKSPVQDGGKVRKNYRVGKRK